MRIRDANLSDWEVLGVMQEVGEDFLLGKVAVDENDTPVMFAGAWMKAEVHCTLSKWGTPGARWLLLQRLHREVEKELHHKGCKEVVTWFDKCETFCKRLQSLGWVKSNAVSWHRRVSG